MASRNYNMAFDTPYNEKLLSTLRKYNMQRDTNGEPNNMHQMSGDPMTGGAFLASDGAISRKSIRYHPHLSNPLTGAMSREMGSMGSMSGGLRPPGMVSPYVQSVSPSHMVVPGTMATYPAYNAVEMRAMNGMDGGFFFPAAMALGRIAGPAIASAVIGAIASKGMEKVLGSGSAACSSCEEAQGHMMPDGSMMLDSQMKGKGRRGRKKGGTNILDRKFSINEVKDTGRQLLGLGILDEKFSINDIGRTAKQLVGRGRRKKGSGILDEKFSINDIGRTAKQLVGRGRRKKGSGILDEKFSINDVKDTGRNLLGLGAKKRGRPKGSKNMKGGFGLRDVANKVGSLVGDVVSVAKPVIKDVAIDLGKQALMSYMTGKSGSTKMPVKRGKGVMSGGLAGVGVMKGGATDGRKRRAEVVKKIMKEKGLKMTDASSYVKKHGLYV